MTSGDGSPLRTAWARPLAAVLIACWLAAVAIPPVAIVAWRDRRLAEVASPEAQAEWDAFRADMRRQSGREGPVQRKVPKSPEPPELVWLRDYLVLAIAAWITLVGVLGGFLAAIALGMARAASPAGLTAATSAGMTAATSAGLTAASPAEDGATGGRHDQKQHDRDSQHADERRHG
ncbi:MAG: hypothetical protein KGR24_06525 [Planctomycetes bacterium]|nr:hypothetical protein [Planctomycetota bacterium]